MSAVSALNDAAGDAAATREKEQEAEGAFQLEMERLRVALERVPDDTDVTLDSLCSTEWDLQMAREEYEEHLGETHLGFLHRPGNSSSATLLMDGSAPQAEVDDPVDSADTINVVDLAAEVPAAVDVGGIGPTLHTAAQSMSVQPSWNPTSAMCSFYAPVPTAAPQRPI